MIIRYPWNFPFSLLLFRMEKSYWNGLRKQKILTLGSKSKKTGTVSFFHKIGFVRGQGSSTQRTPYTFEDAQQLHTGKYYYRLKQIDTNGSFEFSHVVMVEVGGPDEPSLAQNYPNPFNPFTRIRYSLSSDSWVCIYIYNLGGQLIRNLLEGHQKRGRHELTWNGKATDGRSVSSGVYLVRMSAGDLTFAKRILLTK